MKKILIIVILALGTTILYGCAPTNNPLELDEFVVYENGEPVYLTEFEKGTYYFSGLEGNELLGHTLETKRGIKIGSTLDEVISQYKDYAFSGSTPVILVKDYKDFEEFIIDSEAEISEEKARLGILHSSIYFCTFSYKDSLFEERAFRRRLYFKGIRRHKPFISYYSKIDRLNDDRLDIHLYELGFAVEDNIVINIFVVMDTIDGKYLKNTE